MSCLSLDLQASYENDLVLDLFIDSGTTAGAAVKSGGIASLDVDPGSLKMAPHG